MEAYIQAKGLGLTEFATQAQTTDRSLRRFRQTGKIRRDIFENIAKAMKITKEELISE
jgi:energy-converting hydrogenase A subunit M